MRSTLKRAAGPALVAGFVVVSFATPAAAQTPGSTAFRIFGNTVGVQSRTGVQNHVTAAVSNNRLILSDQAGIAAGPGCSQVSATSADCGSVGSVARLLIATGDQNDSVLVTAPVNSTVDIGTGVDSVTTGSGRDVIDVEDNTGNDTVNCGGGSDLVFADSGDTIAANCESRF
ncbi:hypothetical protein ACIRU3_01655 [Streptomyces sp. NPDC101151]|uniref:hypothetical protein n=1 Tax=Streptomyces sp. NPDC101151 TaxID=3366115 RepID=UPI00381E0CC4